MKAKQLFSKGKSNETTSETNSTSENVSADEVLQFSRKRVKKNKKTRAHC